MAKIYHKRKIVSTLKVVFCSDPNKLNNTVFIVDEASMISGRKKLLAIVNVYLNGICLKEVIINCC